MNMILHQTAYSIRMMYDGFESTVIDSANAESVGEF